MAVVAYPFLKVFTEIEKGYDYVTGLVTQYGVIRTENQDLHQELGIQLQRLAEYEEVTAENARLRSMVGFQRREGRLRLEPVEVILRFEGVIMIDRGSRHGIEEAMCVMTKNGIIGIITQVDPFTSNVITLHNADCKIDAMIRRTRVRGIVRGTGSEVSTICRMEYIDLNADIREGDEIVTSPDSIFPSGYPIGRVIAVHEGRGSLLKIVDVLPAANPYRVDEVFVLRQADLSPDDLKGLTRAVEILPDGGHPILDGRSIQERLAP